MSDSRRLHTSFLRTLQAELAACQPIVERFKERGARLGEHENIGYQEIGEILALCAT